MEFIEIKTKRLEDKYIKIKHESGLKIYIYPKKGYNSIYAIYGTKYGSINNKFKVLGEEKETEVPEGIAHFLEHKLFESEDGDAFSKYAKTGASANAYTSFDKTCYLFSCTEKFQESLKILLDFVNTPYFTKETVDKEQGIIGQEIKMYEDSPGWRVMLNLLGAMYHNHPVKIDIAGTVESISKITDKTLYKCYNTFYNPKNMSLCICGDINIDETLKLINNTTKDKKSLDFKNIFVEEPYQIVKEKVKQNFEIASPIFELGFKEKSLKDQCNEEKLALTDIIIEVLVSRSSNLYNRLMKNNLINSSFGCSYLEGPMYAAMIFAGESKNADKAAQIIKEEIEKLKKIGIDEETFNISKKAVYGRTLSALNSTDSIGNLLISLDFSNREIFKYIDCLVDADLISVNRRLEEQLDIENCALSVGLPLDMEE